MRQRNRKQGECKIEDVNTKLILLSHELITFLSLISAANNAIETTPHVQQTLMLSTQMFRLPIPNRSSLRCRS